MSAELAHPVDETRAWRARVILALGPAVSIAGIAWALLQPYRITLLHPVGESFWWLVCEPPLYVVAVGLCFRLLVAPGLLEDLDE